LLVSILVWARQTNQADSLRQALDVLQMQGKFRIKRALYDYALKAAGEL
jgi:predicted nucleic acid-binding protein